MEKLDLAALSVKDIPLGEGEAEQDLVVVHVSGGSLIKGVLQWEDHTGPDRNPDSLPDILNVKLTPSDLTSIPLADAKAVFFVKRPEGNFDHDEVKFFADVQAPTDLWIRITFGDGEVMEGRTENTPSLLLEPGIWLRPFDSTGNNVLVYVPKCSVVDFHVMGVSVPRKARTASGGV